MSSVDLAGLLDLDKEMKGAAVETWADLQRYYEDDSKELTSSELRRLGVGLGDNTTPLEVGILRRIVDRLATVYDQAPTRWLSSGGVRLPEDSDQHALMERLYKKSKVDQALRKVDRRRALSRQEFIRYYPSKHRRAVTLRIFGPNTVARDPNPQEPDCLEADRRFALKLAGDVWEYWEQVDPGVWLMSWVDKAGRPLADQPFAESGGLSPYGAEVPVQLIHDDYPGGAAWLSPRQSRKSWTVAINAVANDLWNMVTHQAHSTRHFASNDPNATLPEASGPNVIYKTMADDRITDITPNPKLRESQDYLEFLLRAWSLSEDLPSEEFQPGRQVLTGAALKVLDRPLAARREAQIPLAFEDEAAGFRKFRAVHNHAAESWGEPRLDDGPDLEVEISEADYPADGQVAISEAESGLKTNQHSVIDLIRRARKVPRAKAIDIYAQVVKDNEQYPSSTADASPPDRGTVGAQTDAILRLNEALTGGKIEREQAKATLIAVFGFEESVADGLLARPGFEPKPDPLPPGMVPAPAPDPIAHAEDPHTTA